MTSEKDSTEENFPISFEGYMLIDKNNRRLKITTTTYEKIKMLRGNCNNMFFRFLQLRSEGLIDMFLSFYPEYKQKFTFYEVDLHNLAKTIHREYMDYHVRHIIAQLSGHFRNIIYKIHGNYMQTKVPTNIGLIMDELKLLHPKQVCHMYNNTFEPHHPYHSNT